MKALTKALALAYVLCVSASIPTLAAGPTPRRAAIPKSRGKAPVRIRAKVARKPTPKPTPKPRPKLVPRPATRATPTSVAAPIPAPSPAPAPAPAPAPTFVPADLAPAIARRVVDLTNEQRTALGLAPLAWDDRLAQSAQGHASNLAARGSLDHIVDGMTPLDRAIAAGYAPAALGENLFRVTPAIPDLSLADGMVAAWMDSPPHAANILSPDFTQIGVGVVLPPADGGTVGLLGVQEFGRPLP